MNVKYINPTFTIPLANLNEPAALQRFCKSMDIFKAAYAFEILNPATLVAETLKIGRTCSAVPGERIYRQAAWLPGWGRDDPMSSSGSDINIIKDIWIGEYTTRTNEWRRQNFTIKIWDVTELPNDSLDKARNTRLAENALLDEYESVYGCLPIGNIKDTRNEKMQSHIPLSVFNRIIDFE